MKIRKNRFALTVVMAQFILSNGVVVAGSINEVESGANEERYSVISTSENKELDNEISNVDIKTKFESRDVVTASGTFGTSNWELDDMGVLHIYGGTFAENVRNPWGAYSSSITKIVFEGDVVAAQNSSILFYNFSNVENIENLNRLDTSNVTHMNSMFNGLSSVTMLDLSNFNTQNVTDMSFMFAGLSSVTTLDIRNFDTKNVTDMRCMFDGLSNVTMLDLSNFNTQNVTDMSFMFDGLSSVTILDIRNFVTRNVTDMTGMFNEASSITKLDVSGFDTSNVLNMSAMFYNANNLERLSLGTNCNSLNGVQTELPTITKDGYTGRWLGLTKQMIFSSSRDFMTNFVGAQHADTYVWEKEAKDVNDFIVPELEDIIYTGCKTDFFAYSK